MTLILNELRLFKFYLFRVNLYVIDLFVTFSWWGLWIVIITWVKHVFNGFRLKLRPVSFKNLLEVYYCLLVHHKQISATEDWIYMHGVDFCICSQLRDLLVQALSWLFWPLLLCASRSTSSCYLNFPFHSRYDTAWIIECPWLQKGDPESRLCHIRSASIWYSQQRWLKVQRLESNHMWPWSFVIQAILIFCRITLELPLNSASQFYL